jgi:hypothetical protein
VAPLPSFPVIYANGLLFGTLSRGLLSWVSVLVSVALSFGLARCWGRPMVERLANPAALRRAEALFPRHGTLAVLLARLLPLTAIDLLSYAAGLTRMRLRSVPRRHRDRHDAGDLPHGLGGGQGGRLAGCPRRRRGRNRGAGGRRGVADRPLALAPRPPDALGEPEG